MAELADARDLKSREIFSRTGSTPASGTNNIAEWSSLVARRAHNPKVMRFKSHLRNQKRFHSRYNFGYGILLYIRKRLFLPLKPLISVVPVAFFLIKTINPPSSAPQRQKWRILYRSRVQSFIAWMLKKFDICDIIN